MGTKITDDIVLGTMRNLLGDSSFDAHTDADWRNMPKFTFGNYSTNAPCHPHSPGFSLEHVRSGVSMQCGEGHLLDNVVGVCKAMTLIMDYLDGVE